MTHSPDFSVFTSRLNLKSTLTFSAGMRIGSGRSGDAEESDLPVLRDALGRPYIPGSSFKGALRSYVESILRAMQDTPQASDKNLACLSVGKAEKRANGERPDLCLTQDEVSLIKKFNSANGQPPSETPAGLRERLAALPPMTDPDAFADRALQDLCCWACRVFGAPWLASKVLIRDLPLKSIAAWPVDIRDGVAIDRDAGRAAGGMKYTFEALPAGAAFDVQILVENASDAELGLVWLGLMAFERGEIPLGGARSRGLGWCQLVWDWPESRLLDRQNLLAALFEQTDASASSDLAQKPAAWVRAFKQAITA